MTAYVCTMTWSDLAHYNQDAGREMTVADKEVSIWKEEDSMLTFDKFIKKADLFIVYSSSIEPGLWKEAQN
jgi:hypothetical protein